MKKKIAVFLLTLTVFITNIAGYEHVSAVEQKDNTTYSNIQNEILGEQESYWRQFKNDYYYNQLSKNQKDAWDKFDQAAMRYLLEDIQAKDYQIEISFKENGMTVSELKDMFYIFKNSNPQYYFLGGVLTSNTEESFKITILPVFSTVNRSSYTYQLKDSINYYTMQIDAYTKDCSEEELEYKRAEAIYMLCCNDVTYADNETDKSKYKVPWYSDTYAQSVYTSMVLNQTVCTGYTMMQELLYDYYGIENTFVDYYNHIYNRVCIDNTWYIVDAMDGAISSKKRGISYDNFLVSTEKKDDHHKTYSNHNAVYDTFNLNIPECVTEGEKSSTERYQRSMPIVKFNKKEDGSYWVEISLLESQYGKSDLYFNTYCDKDFTIDSLDFKNGFQSVGGCGEGLAIEFKQNNGIENFYVVAYSKPCHEQGPNYDSSKEIWYDEIVEPSMFRIYGFTTYEFEGNGAEVPETLIKETNTSFETSFNEEQNNWTFLGWNTNNEKTGYSYEYNSKFFTSKIPTTKTTFNALWKKSYSVTYDNFSYFYDYTNHKTQEVPTVDITVGDTFSSNHLKVVEDGKTYYVGEQYEKTTTRIDNDWLYTTTTTYTLKGFYTQNKDTSTNTWDESKKVDENTVFNQKGNIKLYARWDKSSKTDYTAAYGYIHYMLNGGTNNDNNPSKYDGLSDVVFKAPVKAGYRFDGWYTDNDFKTKITSLPKGYEKTTIVLYAKWLPIYKITYYLNSGVNNKANPSTYTNTDTITLKNPTRKGYSFAGWYTTKDYKTKVSSIKKGTTGNKVFYAKWVKNYTITYKLNGGKNNSTNPTYYCSLKKITLSSPSKAGYLFNGWYADSKYKTKVTSISTSASGNKTLYAKWTKISLSKVSLSALTNVSGKKLKVTWKKVSGATSYQIRYSTKSNMSDSKYVTTNSCQKTLSSLTKNKTYYVQVRAIRKDSTGANVYGSWSSKKSLKIKK